MTFIIFDNPDTLSTTLTTRRESVSAVLEADKKKIVDIALHESPDLKALYLFGSFASGNATLESDIDIALLSATKISADVAFKIKSKLSLEFKRDIDLIDLLQANTVTKALVVTEGNILFQVDSLAIGLFETTVLSQYANLSEERAEIVQDILNRGSVHG